MKKLLILMFLVVFVYSCTDTEAPGINKGQDASLSGRPDTVRNYINAAIDTMQKYSINKEKIDWNLLREETLNQSKEAKTYVEAYPVLRQALKKLKDRHSFFKTPEQKKAWSSEAVSKPTDNARWRPPVGILRDGNVAELRITSFASGNLAESLKYVKSIQEAIRRLDQQNPKGWVIDLSSNKGGNMWPMLAAIGPFLDSGVQGGFCTPSGNLVYWYYNGHEVGNGNEVMLRFPESYQLRNKNLPIVVFISKHTASSGEGILIALKNNPNVRIFGEPTAGLTTANGNYTLKDGAELIITSAIFTDKNDNLYGDKIMPDVNLSDKWYYISGFEHAIMLSEARKWFDSFHSNR